MNLDATVYQRSCARASKDWAESDRLRKLLREHGCIVTDTKDFQEAIFLPYGVTADQYEARLAADKKAEAVFEAWLYSYQRK